MLNLFTDNDVARSSFNIPQLQIAMSHAYRILSNAVLEDDTESSSLCDNSILSRVIQMPHQKSTFETPSSDGKMLNSDVVKTAASLHSTEIANKRFKGGKTETEKTKDKSSDNRARIFKKAMRQRMTQSMVNTK